MALSDGRIPLCVRVRLGELPGCLVVGERTLPQHGEAVMSRKRTVHSVFRRCPIAQIYTVNLEPRVGTKPGKQRPCVTIQPNEFAESGLPSTVILPLTTRLSDEDAFPLRVSNEKGVCGLKQPSEVLIDQILAWDNSMFQKDLGEVPEGIQEVIKRAIKEFLDLD